MKTLYPIVTLLTCLFAMFEPLPLLAKKQNDPPEDVIYKYYPRPEEIVAEAVQELKKEFPNLLKKELDHRVSRPYGFWPLYGMPNKEVAKGAALPFEEQPGLSNGLIECDKGTFKIAVNGIFSITFGIVDANQKCRFEVQKKSKSDLAFKTIPGGTLIYKYENGSSNALTVLIQAEVDDLIKVVNTHSNAFKLGAQALDQEWAYFSIYQID